MCTNVFRPVSPCASVQRVDGKWGQAVAARVLCVSVLARLCNAVPVSV